MLQTLPWILTEVTKNYEDSKLYSYVFSRIDMLYIYFLNHSFIQTMHLEL